MSGFFGSGGGGGGDVANPMTEALDADYQEIVNPTLQGYAEAVASASVSGTQDIDCSLSNVFRYTLTADCAFNLVSPASGGVLTSVTLFLTQDGTGGWTPTFDGEDSSAVDGEVIWPNETTPTLDETAGVTHILTFNTIGDGTWYGAVGPSNYNLTP